MNILVSIVLYGWFPAVILIFRELRGHRAVAFSFIAATLFLPVAEFPFYGLPEYNKSSATSMAVLLAALLFEPLAIIRFRPRWFDVPVAMYCLSPVASAIANDLGVSHGVSLSMECVFNWGLPYFIGRMFFCSFDSIRTLAYAIFIGGLVYVPLCLFEVRMSPQLHTWVYGFRPGSWSVVRYNGYRPSVFMEEGLAVGMYMTAASLVGIWLWRSKAVGRVWGVDVRWLLAVMLLATTLCKCTGALGLLAIGLAVLTAYRSMRSPWPVAGVALLSVVYIGVRSAGMYDGSHVVAAASELVGEERAVSLDFRLKNEDMLVERALQMPIFGWGGFGRNRVYDEYGKDLTITDGFWIITLGNFGFVGLCSVYAMFLVVPTLVAFRFYKREWNAHDSGPVIAISVLLILYMIDCLLNAMVIAVFPLCLGAISTVYGRTREKLVDDETNAHVEGMTMDRLHTPMVRRKLWPPARPETPVAVSN
jgi:hypothetical protein